MVHSPWSVASDVRQALKRGSIYYGLWTMDYGLWTIDYRLSTIDSKLSTDYPHLFQLFSADSRHLPFA
jgi:hypothetical protein